MRHAALCLIALTLFAGPLFAQKEFGFDNTKSSGQPYLKPAETVARMKVADGFEVKLFASEPDIVNPIAMTVDEKGRVWVVESFEYPKRTPKGKMPRDRIKILEDTDGDGVCDKVTIFAEGKDFPVPFDMASGIEVGYGGVFLGAAPYLFFIENKNDKPGKIEILLQGFGSEDTHEVLNTFQWGPDGRLYGLHGVFTRSDVKPPDAKGPGVKLNAGVWRYDVKAKKFEIFSEGTSNPWGMDWRNTDGQFILCCCVIPHLFHMVPGGIYKRQAGQSFNPYAYGEIKEICDHTFHKESGWAHAGLVSLDTPLMPEKYRNSVIFGSIHGCSIKQNILKPNGSSYIASRGDDFLVSGDKNFRPINLRWGHNGEIYCSDWHDQHPCHQTKPDDWDYNYGRVYRIQPKGLKTKKAEDLGALPVNELGLRVADLNPFVYRTALRLLRERHSKFTQAERAAFLSAGPRSTAPDFRLRSLLYDDTQELLDQLSDELLADWIAPTHRSPTDLAWAIRLCAQLHTPPPGLGKLLAGLANNKDAGVRRELASAALRLAPRVDTTDLVRGLLSHAEDANDPVLPQLLWTAYERKLPAAPDFVWLKDKAPGNALITDTIIPRTMRRLVATGKAEDLTACVAFVGELKDSAARRAALDGLVIALKDRQVDAPANWKAVRAELAKIDDKDVQGLVGRLSVNFRDLEALRRSMGVASDSSKSANERGQAIRDLALAHPTEALAVLLKLARSEPAAELRTEAIRALGRFDSPQVAKDLLAEWAKYPPAMKNEVIQVLAGRKEWARELLAAVGAKKVQRTELTDNTILRMQAFRDKQLEAQIEKVWGRVRPTPAELNALIDKMRGELNSGRASFARGKVVFDNQCAKCHKFDGRGHQVGPDIEGAGRDVEYLLTNVLDPNRVIGAPYFMRTINLADGSIVTGVLAAEDDQTLTIKTENAVMRVIPKKDIESQRTQEKSLMPEGLANNMSTQDFRDLVRYVMANPFLTEVQIRNDKTTTTPVVPPSGRIALPESDGKSDLEVITEVTAPENMKAQLLLGHEGTADVWINDHKVPAYEGNRKGEKSAASPATVALDLKKGINRIAIRLNYSGKGRAVYARFVDPERRLFYHDWLAEKKRPEQK